MDLKELSKLDIKSLKNIDLNEIKENIKKRPDILINFLIIGATISGIIYMFSTGQKKTQQLKNQNAQYKQKLDAVKELDQTKKEKEEFIKNFPQAILSNRLIDKVGEIASAHNVLITGSKPAKTTSNDIMEYTTMTLNISSSEYSDIVAFIKDIEESPNALKVNRWVGGLKEKGAGRRTQQSTTEDQVKTSIDAEVEITSIKIKE